jgi:hypothetical protein
LDFDFDLITPYFNVTSGGIGVVREHQLQKTQPLPFIKGGTKEEKKQKS